jgi:endo-1,3-1,4-beta-glycanase ExoK
MRFFERILIALGVIAAVAVVAAPTILILVSLGSIFLAQPKQYAEKEVFAPLPASVTFIDRFRTLDDARWVFSDGWNNGTWMENDWRRDALSLTSDGLAITMRANPNGPGRRPYMSGELQSREEYLYGYFEASMRVPRGDGVVAGLFTFVRPEGASTWEEIDIEFLGARPRMMEVTYHVHGFSRQETVNLGFDPSQGFNTYGFEWTPDAVRWYVNNRLVYEVMDERVQRLRRPQRFFLSLWGTRELYQWAGYLDAAEAPWVMEVSCIAHARQYDGVSLCARPGG